MKLKPYLTRWCQVSLILCLTYIFWGFLQVVNVQAATIEEGKALFEQLNRGCPHPQPLAGWGGIARQLSGSMPRKLPINFWGCFEIFCKI
jgi:hypothetical protein